MNPWSPPVNLVVNSTGQSSWQCAVFAAYLSPNARQPSVPSPPSPYPPCPPSLPITETKTNSPVRSLQFSDTRVDTSQLPHSNTPRGTCQRKDQEHSSAVTRGSQPHAERPVPPMERRCVSAPTMCTICPSNHRMPPQSCNHGMTILRSLQSCSEVPKRHGGVEGIPYFFVRSTI